jgi:hypothetical protein
MPRIRPSLTVLDGASQTKAQSQLEAAYDHFRLDRQGNLVSRATLEHYDFMVTPWGFRR